VGHSGDAKVCLLGQESLDLVGDPGRALGFETAAASETREVSDPVFKEIRRGVAIEVALRIE
jgi:hypothetical protein